MTDNRAERLAQIQAKALKNAKIAAAFHRDAPPTRANARRMPRIPAMTMSVG
jgi:hypothetical protein